MVEWAKARSICEKRDGRWPIPLCIGRILAVCREGGKRLSHPTQFGRDMGQLGIERIAACPPQARGYPERAFATRQDRLPGELAMVGIRDMATANRYLEHGSRWRPGKFRRRVLRQHTRAS
jgi:hypothetical protein